MKTIQLFKKAIFAAAFLFTLLPVRASYLIPTERISINAEILDATYKYLLNDGSRSTTGVLGSTAMAYFDAAGTVTLHNYTGSSICDRSQEGSTALTVNLIGTNTINQSGEQYQYGIEGKSSDIMITSTEGGSLTINVHSTVRFGYGIRTVYFAGGNSGNNGDIVIDGNATVAINTTSGADPLSYAGYALSTSGNIIISGAANFSCKTISSCINHGSLATTLTINTTGNVTFDASVTNETSTDALRCGGGITLMRVGVLTLKWKGTGDPTYPHPFTIVSPTEYKVNKATPNTVIYTYTGPPLTFTNNGEYDVPAGNISTPITNIYLSGGVSGGTPPDTYSKTSGPAWLNVSSEGVITGTRPSTIQAETSALIMLKDDAGNVKNFSIKVGAVTTPYVTFTATQTGGAAGTANSTGIILTFSQAVTGLSADDITITPNSGSATKGAELTGSATTWTIALDDVTAQGTVSVSVANFGEFIMNTTSYNAYVYKDLPREVIVGTQDGVTPVQGTSGTATYSIYVPLGVSGAVTLSWFTDAEGTLPASTPDGVLITSSTTLTGTYNGTLVLTTYNGYSTAAGKYYFRVNVGGEPSNMSSLTVLNTTALKFDMLPQYYEWNYSVPEGTVGTEFKLDASLATYGSALSLYPTSGGATGGLPPYSFSIESSDWLETILEEVSSGVFRYFIIGARPLSPQDETTATLKVTDANGDYASVIINVGEVMAVGLEDIVPLAPDFFTAIPGDGEVYLSWATPYDGGSPITKYQYRVNAGLWTDIPDSDETTENYTVTDLSNGTSYTFEIRAVNVVGNGAIATQTATPLGKVTFTAEQTGGASGTTNSTGIVLTFDKSVSGLKAGDITISNNTGAVVKGTLEGLGTTWTIGLSSVDMQGDVIVSIENFDIYEIMSMPQFVEVYSATTGIVQTVANKARIIGYCNLFGQRLPQEPGKGIYIILYDNGKTVKVIKN